jgi:uncharacterized protein YkwD
MKTIAIAFFALLSFSCLSQDRGLSDMAFNRMAKENTQTNSDSAYFANYELDSAKLTQAILSELNRVRKLNSVKIAVSIKDTAPCKYIMDWSNYLASVNKIGHGGTRLYCAEVATGGSINKSQSFGNQPYELIAKQTVQSFIDSPEHKRIILSKSYTSAVIGFSYYPGKYTGLNTVVVIGFR